MKYCPDCKAKLPYSEFRSNRCRSDGVSSYCRKHQTAREKQTRIKNGVTYRKPGAAVKSSSGCTCRDFQNCIPCRNAERRRAFKAGDIPAYRLRVIANLQTGKSAGD